VSFAPALTDLASLVESTSSTREAIGCWRAPGDPRLRDPVARVARRARLGAPWRVVVEPLASVLGPDARLLADMLETHARCGGPVAPGLRSLASTIADRERMGHEADAAATAARASGRLLAALAVTILLVLPQWRQASGAVIAASSFLVGSLVWGARAWIRRLVPLPPRFEVPGAALARRLDGSLGAGLDITAALEAASATEPSGSEFARARARVRLGASWPEALASSGSDQLDRLADLVRRAQRYGIELRPSLVVLADRLREEERRRFELRARRAPVLLVLPLTLLMLPAFTIVILLPLLRSVAG
jgi:tight adherence protein B